MDLALYYENLKYHKLVDTHLYSIPHAKLASIGNVKKNRKQKRVSETQKLSSDPPTVVSVSMQVGSDIGSTENCKCKETHPHVTPNMTVLNEASFSSRVSFKHPLDDQERKLGEQLFLQSIRPFTSGSTVRIVEYAIVIIYATSSCRYRYKRYNSPKCK